MTLPVVYKRLHEIGGLPLFKLLEQGGTHLAMFTPYKITLNAHFFNLNVE